MPRDHATLSASSSARWIACPPSALLQDKYPDKGSEATAEGTDAHTLGEWKVKRYLGKKEADPRGSLTYYDEEMEEYTDRYASFIEEQVEIARAQDEEPLVLVEQRVDFSPWVPDGFGTADAIIVHDGHLTICDLKYGLGVVVNAEHNPQMSCYALGALQMLDDLYDIRDITMVIFQPRCKNISIWNTDTYSLLKWADAILKPAAALAIQGKGQFVAGKHCRFCKARHECRVRAEEQLRLLKYDFAQPPTLTDDEIMDILGQLDRLTRWADEVRLYAQESAIHGKHWNGYKLVESRTSRRFTDEVAVAKAVIGYGKDPYERKLRSVTDLTKLLGKLSFDKLLGGYVEKPHGKPTLVPMSDNRPAIDKNDF